MIVGDQADLKALQKQLQGTRNKTQFVSALLIVSIAIAAGVALSNDETAKAKVEGQIAAKNIEITNFTNFKVYLDQLNTAGESLSQATSQMQQGWDTLRADIQEVIAKLKVFPVQKQLLIFGLFLTLHTTTGWMWWSWQRSSEAILIVKLG